MCPWRSPHKYASMPAIYDWVGCLSIATLHRAQTYEIPTSSDYKNWSAVKKKSKNKK
jgi:hypothetical protein